MVRMNKPIYREKTNLYNEEYFTKGGDMGGYVGYCDYPQHAKRVEKIVAMANPKSVLDVGGAYGYITRRLLDMNIEAVCLDISEWCEKQSAEIIPDHFVQHDIRFPMPFKYKEFDLLYCEGVLEHIEDEYILDIMREFERVAHKRILQLTFDTAANGKETQGHTNVHDRDWWLARIPSHTWLMYEDQPTNVGNIWIYRS